MSAPLRPLFLLPFVLFAGGALAGWQTRAAKAPAPATSATPAAGTKHADRKGRQLTRAAVPAEVAARLAPILNAPNPTERLRATIALARSLPVSELEKWYDAEWFTLSGGMEENLFYRITRARWLEEEPAGLMKHCLRNSNDQTYVLATEWGRTDPAGALAFLTGLKDPADRNRIASALSGGIAETDPDLLERESAFWPATLRKEALNSISQAALKKDFAAGIAALRDAPDGMERFTAAMNDSTLASQLLDHAASLPPGWLDSMADRGWQIVSADPGKWLSADLAALGFDKQHAQQMRSYAIDRLSSKDPQRALEMARNPDLAADERINLMQDGLSTLAQQDRAAAEAWAAGLTDEAQIAMAQETLKESSSSVSSSDKPIPPKQWLSELAGMNNGSGLWNHLQRAGSWNQEETAEARDAFRQLPDEQRVTVAQRLSDSDSNGAAPSLRAEALNYLLENPPDLDSAPDPDTGRLPSSPLPGVVQFASSWGSQDPQAAGQWVKSLPPGEARLWAAKNLAAQWADYEPSAALQWAAGLPASERTQVESYLKNSGGSKP